VIGCDTQHTNEFARCSNKSPFRLLQSFSKMLGRAFVAAGWSVNPLSSGAIIGRSEVEELRTALVEARAALGLSALTVTDAPLVSRSLIKAVHINERRGGVR
jgi:hypothetical protein